MVVSVNQTYHVLEKLKNLIYAWSYEKITFTVPNEFIDGMTIIQIKIHHELCTNKQHGRINKYNSPRNL